MRFSLIVFAKVPQAGSVKTRMTAVMTPGEAAELYRCMLHDTLLKAGRFVDAMPVAVFFEPTDGAEAYFADAAQGMELISQVGNGLGERMEQAFRIMFARGAEAVVIIGTDIPHLPSCFISDAFALLEQPETDVVFGPATDGGYYLLGMKRLHPQLFTGIAWSSGTVLRGSMTRGKDAGLHMVLLPACSDLDTPDDLLRPEVLDKRNEAPLTRGFLHRFFGRGENRQDREQTGSGR